MSFPAIRTDIRDLLLTVTNLGGDDATQANRKVHKFFAEVDDIEEHRAYWETTVGSEKQINGIMLTRTNRDDEEPHATGAVREFATLHQAKLLFRFGKAETNPKTPTVEGEFETILEEILDKLKGAGLFDRAEISQGSGELSPMPFGNQVARVEITNKKLFNTRVWEAAIFFVVVEQEFKTPGS